MRPGRCKLAGLAVSAGWIVGAALLVRAADFRAAKFLWNSAFEVCDYVERRLFAYADCWRDLMALASALDSVWADLVLFALVPVALLWLAAWAARQLRQGTRASRV